MSKTFTRITNSRACSYSHTINATNVSEGYVHFAFDVAMPLSAIIQCTNDDGVVEDIAGCKIEYPADGEVKFTPSAGNVAEVTKVICVADDTGSLNNTYFKIYSTTVTYVVWINVNSAGSDPSLPSTTSVPIAVATDATAATIAAAIKTALDGISGGAVFTTTRSTATLTITRGTAGQVSDTTDGASAAATGFTISTTTQGVTGATVGYTLELGKKVNILAFRDSVSVGTYTS
jgi:hypothetical protein